MLYVFKCKTGKYFVSWASAATVGVGSGLQYDRWWEARKILGGMLGVTRDLMRQVGV